MKTKSITYRRLPGVYEDDQWYTRSIPQDTLCIYILYNLVGIYSSYKMFFLIVRCRTIGSRNWKIRKADMTVNILMGTSKMGPEISRTEI